MQVDQGVDLIKGKLLAMASLAEDMVERSVHALLEGDDEVARQVRADDDKLDATFQNTQNIQLQKFCLFMLTVIDIRRYSYICGRL